MSDSPIAIILTGPGINCDHELARAFELAGASPRFVHLSELMAEPARLDEADLIGLPGGFSYGDAIAAGRVFAQMIRQHLYPAFVRAIERGAPMIAPCNGFQIAVQAGLLPGPDADSPWPIEPAAPCVTLTSNASARFIDRWCRIEVPVNTRCVWTKDLKLTAASAMLPIAHGEGRFVPDVDSRLTRLEQAGQIAVRYAADDNPNGSAGDVAGICDASGLIFGLMPHPERYTTWSQHPLWSRLNEADRQEEPPGLAMFRRAVSHVVGAAALRA